MEIRRAAETVFRSTPSPLSLLPIRSARPIQCRTARVFHPVPHSTSVRSASTSATAEPTQQEKSTPKTSPPSRSRTSSDAINHLDALFREKVGDPTPPSRAANFYNDTRSANSNAFARMNIPSRSAMDMTPRVEQDVGPAPFRISAALGRTIDVSTRGNDLGRAFRQLEIRCAVNSVRRDLNRQRFHERPGLRRKRLKSERWRRRFKVQFQETIARVQELRRKGW